MKRYYSIIITFEHTVIHMGLKNTESTNNYFSRSLHFWNSKRFELKCLKAIL